MKFAKPRAIRRMLSMTRLTASVRAFEAPAVSKWP